MASKVIILTGASRGIGLAAAHYLLKNQHKVLAIARSEGPLKELQNQYPSGQVEILAADLGDFTTADKAIQLCLTTFGRIDSLILNHGTLDPISRLDVADATQWAEGFIINFISLIPFIRASIPHLRKTRGTVIFTSSGAATHPYQTWGCYGSTKAAMNHLCSTLGAEEPEITAISVRPGVVDTAMQKDIRELHGEAMGEGWKKFEELHKDGKLLRPEQPGHVIAKLAVGAPKELSGKFVSWNGEEVKEFQE